MNILLVGSTTIAQNSNSPNPVALEICADKPTSFAVLKNNIDNSCFQPISLQTLNQTEYQEHILLKVEIIDKKKKFIVFNKKIDSVKVFFPVTEQAKTFLSGRLVARSDKQLLSSMEISAIEVPLDYNYGQSFYIELVSSQQLPINADLEILTEREFEQNKVFIHHQDTIIHSIFQGMLWIILLYNLFIFAATKEQVYVAYSIYIFGFSIFNAQNSGFFSDYIIPNYPYFSSLVRIFGLAAAFLGHAYFTLEFLPKEVFGRFWKKFFHAYIIFVSFMTLVYIAVMYGTNNLDLYTKLSKTIHALMMVSLVSFLIYLAVKRWSDTMTKYYLLASLVLVLGAFIFNALQAFGIEGAGVIVEIGGVLEILIFSLGLGHRMKNLEKENARILEEQNRTLEQKVQERTQEISKQKEEILVQNEELHQQQEEIISQRDYIDTQNKQLKTANTQFTDSIRYAKTIQKAILPMKLRFQQHFEDSFVLFRPRDIVSGDFYWIYETKDQQTGEDTTLIAVLDCTGHGVPGAFISLIGFALLNEIVAKENITSPSKILKRLDERIQESLRQKQKHNLDGMDVAMCAIKKTNSYKLADYEIKFAGAKRPIHFIKDNQLCEIRGSKLSIGGMTKKRIVEKHSFEEQTIILSKNDKIYLSSDGFIDQNGENNRKIGSAQLKKYFNDYHHLPFAEQKKKFEEILDKHQGKVKQRDDITILGLKL
ncbi:PP2C family protein-serine/threonine phosphatase [Bernardetia sp.]|uniref:PP2C family protein-serine/threonine phosphatase n=1 Tax=Bernardetia sp. TaxID=1937974 RepID=UPI0025C60669|nr:7TM diverse intracellular signaling domain-containing protein [Bernardetia sp.]